MKIPENALCHRPWTGFELYDHLGDVRPCCWGKVSCGNINSQSKEEIWDGDIYELYRERMAIGDTKSICKDNCPILQGLYKEPIPSNQVTNGAPKFLRVVPSIKCNLKCKFCYQLSDPPPDLPENLFEDLEIWLESAVELQLLGGETFIAREAIDWITKVSKERFPSLKLSAITNGLGFSEEICQLIASRNWSWILVSIDAASDEGFRQIRGGNFFDLMTGLDNLSVVRAQMQEPFELRFGFTIQNSNLNELTKFINLCDKYGALPQFTLVFGDWHGERPTTHREFRNLLEALEKLDKLLHKKGFGDRLLEPVFAQLNIGSVEPVRRSEFVISQTYFSKEPVASDVLLSSTLNMGPPELHLVDYNISLDNTTTYLGTLSTMQENAQLRVDKDYWITSSYDLSQVTESKHVVLHIDDSFSEILKDSLGSLDKLDVDSYSISIPFFEDNRPVSALKYSRLVERIKSYAEWKNWEFVPGYHNVQDFGISLSDQIPHIKDYSISSIDWAEKLSIVVPIYNREQQLDTFLSSLIPQLSNNTEVILVDDGSNDGSVEKMQSFFLDHRMRLKITIIELEREIPYQFGTFSFRAGVARQVALQFVGGSHVLFLDPDQLIDSNCIESHLTWANRGFDVIIGDRRDRNDIFSKWNDLRTETLLGRPNWWLSFFTGNSSVKMSKLIEAGGFDRSLLYWGLDDTDLAYRLHQIGCNFWHTTRAVVTHLANDSGGGQDQTTRNESYRIHMEVLYRKYLNTDILNAFEFLWPHQTK